MPSTNEKFDQLKLDRLKYFLQAMAEKGQPRPYEIFVDALKVVPKTEDPKEFDSYEHYLNEDTEKIRILIYYSGESNRNDQYCFYMQQHKPEKSLNGLGDIDTIIQDKLTSREKEYELARLKDELEETRQRLEESEEYARDLEVELEQARNNKHKIGNIDLGELGAHILGKFVQRNADSLAKIGLEGLAGGPSKEIGAGQSQDTEASFQKKGDADSQIAPELLPYLPLLQQMDAVLEREQLDLAMQIIGDFLRQPAHIQTVAELLNISLTTKAK